MLQTYLTRHRAARESRRRIVRAGRDQSGGDNNADQFSAACEYDLSARVMLYASAGMLRNHGSAEFTLRGVDVTGLTPAYPGAPVRGVQFGLIDRF